MPERRVPRYFNLFLMAVENKMEGLEQKLLAELGREGYPPTRVWEAARQHFARLSAHSPRTPSTPASIRTTDFYHRYRIIHERRNISPDEAFPADLAQNIHYFPAIESMFAELLAPLEEEAQKLGVRAYWLLSKRFLGLKRVRRGILSV